MQVSNPDVSFNYQSKYPLPMKTTNEILSSFYVGDFKLSSLNSDHGHGRWLLCDGRPYSPVEYPDLYEAIGASFGSLSGGTPLLPDMRGRVPGGIGQGIGLSNRTRGQQVGTETHTLTIPEMPSHIHTNSVSVTGNHAHSITDNGHSHTYLGVGSQNAASGLDNVAENSPRPVETTSNVQTGIIINPTGDHNHTVTIDATGGSLPHQNMQPTLFIGNYFIYAKYV